MTTAQLPKVQSSGGINDIAALMNALGPMLGSGNTKSSSSTGADAGTLNQTDELLKKIMGDSNSGDIDNMVASILDRAKQSFGPAAIASNAAGVRAYSDSSLASMRNEAMARATGEAAKAKLDAINAANNQATQLVTAKLKATQTTTQQQKTGASPGGKLLGGGLALSQLYAGVKKAKAGYDARDVNTGNASTGDFSSGGGFDDSITDGFSATNDAANAGDGGIDSLLNFSQTAEAADAANAINVDSPDGSGADINAPVEGADVLNGATAGDVVTGGFEMPPAQTVDPVTGIPNAMPPAVDGVQAADDAEAIDVIPSAIDFSADAGSAVDIGSGAADLSGEAAGEVAGETLGDIFFPGFFTAVNYGTDGALGEGIGGVINAGEDVVGGSISGDASYTNVISDAGNAATDAIDQFFGGVGDIVDNACFITTAATKNGELDDGYTLTALRQFRKEYMQTPERQSELVDYHILAPIIIKRISESANPDHIWKEIRESFLNPAVLYFKGGFPEVTHAIYSNMMYWARQQVGLANPEGVH